uniref:Lipocalin n=1 Tax=Rhipicephalus appendiculatus TaxID=34631 RepID=A0A131YRE0_RHIAP
MYKVSIILLAVLVLNAAEARSDVRITFVGLNFTIYNVEKFMNSSEKIWTIVSTRAQYFWCMVDTTRNITDDIIYFERDFFDFRGDCKHLRCQGQVDRWMNNTMAVTCQEHFGSSVRTVEILMYATEDYKCGVFYVYEAQNGIRNGWYDLRYKSNQIGDVPQKCWIDFQKRRNNTNWQTIYNESICKHCTPRQRS